MGLQLPDHLTQSTAPFEASARLASLEHSWHAANPLAGPYHQPNVHESADHSDPVGNL